MSSDNMFSDDTSGSDDSVSRAESAMANARSAASGRGRGGRGSRGGHEGGGFFGRLSLPWSTKGKPKKRGAKKRDDESASDEEHGTTATSKSKAKGTPRPFSWVHGDWGNRPGQVEKYLAIQAEYLSRNTPAPAETSKKSAATTKVTEPSGLDVSLEDIGVVLTDVMSFLPLKDLVTFLSTSSTVHQWYDVSVEFRMAIAYTDAPWAGLPTHAVTPAASSATPLHPTYNSGDNDKVRSTFPRTKPRWSYCPINYWQYSAGYLQPDELPRSQDRKMAVVPEISYFNLRSLCCSTMTTSKAHELKHLTADYDHRGDDYYDPSTALHAGEYLLAGLVANNVVIRSTGGIGTIGRGFLRSTTAVSVTIAADRYTGAKVVAPTSIDGGWLGDCPNLTSLDCQGLDYVETVGSRWLERNNALRSVAFTGLKRLSFVGESWLNSCQALVHVDFSGLGQLTTVNGWWMRECVALQWVSLKGLRQLSNPGGRWLEKCSSLKRIYLSDASVVQPSWVDQRGVSFIKGDAEGDDAKEAEQWKQAAIH